MASGFLVPAQATCNIETKQHCRGLEREPTSFRDQCPLAIRGEEKKYR